MPRIQNDHELREALQALTAEQQRRLGARFAERVAHLCNDERVNRAIAAALRDGISASELEDAYKAARGYAIKTYTQCGKDTDWLAQADHFVAAAAAAALTPEATPETPPEPSAADLKTERQNRAWRAAVQARMAINCAMMESDEVTEEIEARLQYSIANAFLGQE